MLVVIVVLVTFAFVANPVKVVIVSVFQSAPRIFYRVK